MSMISPYMPVVGAGLGMGLGMGLGLYGGYGGISSGGYICNFLIACRRLAEMFCSILPVQLVLSIRIWSIHAALVGQLVRGWIWFRLPLCRIRRIRLWVLEGKSGT